MNKLNFYLEKVIGKRIREDLYDANGTLLIPVNTVITYDHIILLEENNISLSETDVREIGADFEQHSQIIDEAVGHVRSIFGNIRKTRKVPLVPLREQVIPLIHAVSNSKHLIHLFAALQAKDDYTYRHNIAVGAISNLIGKWMNLNQQDLMKLTTAALLHDVGKVLVPEDILNKSGKLTDEEFILIKKHTEFGYDILKETVGISHRQALVALQHHERMDGSGYPLGLKKDEINLYSRIVSVADVFHAMSSDRVYQNQFPFYKVISEMEKEMFGFLDPEITFIFIENTMNLLIGNTVQLTDGREGTIILVSQTNPTHPLIKVENEFIDLSKNRDLHIEEIKG